MLNMLAQRRPPGAIAWNDVEALPLHAATLMLVLAVAYGLADAGVVLQSTTAKVACIVGCLGLRSAWIGMDDMQRTRGAN